LELFAAGVGAPECDITFVDWGGGDDGAADLGDLDRSLW
jgi:hypothetical protein